MTPDEVTPEPRYHVCVVCMLPVARDEYFAHDYAHEACDMNHYSDFIAPATEHETKP